MKTALVTGGASGIGQATARALADRIQKLLVGISEAQAKTILPTHYTGFVAATHESYRMIEDAGVLVGRLKKK